MRSARRLLSQLPAPWEATYAAKTRSELLAAYAAWAPTYDADSVDAFGYTAPHAAAEALARHVADVESAAVLDAGAGTGQVGEHLAQLNFTNVVGVDLSEPMLDVARQKGCYRRLLCADLSDPHMLPPASLDSIVCVGTLTQPCRGRRDALRLAGVAEARRHLLCVDSRRFERERSPARAGGSRRRTVAARGNDCGRTLRW